MNYPDTKIIDMIIETIENEITKPIGSLTIISPWFYDFPIKLHGRANSFLHDQYGGKLDFFTLISDIAEMDHIELSIVCTPPDNQISPYDIKNIINTYTIVDKYLNQNYDAYDKDLIDQKENADNQARKLKRDAKWYSLLSEISDRVDIHFNDKLHAKVIITPNSVLLGSANMSYSGVLVSDELMVRVTNKEDVEKLQLKCNNFKLQDFAYTYNEYDYVNKVKFMDRNHVFDEFSMEYFQSIINHDWNPDFLNLINLILKYSKS